MLSLSTHILYRELVIFFASYVVLWDKLADALWNPVLLSPFILFSLFSKLYTHAKNLAVSFPQSTTASVLKDFYLTITSLIHDYRNYNGFMNTPKCEIRNVRNLIKHCPLLGAQLIQYINIYSTTVDSTLCRQTYPLCHWKVATSCCHEANHYLYDSLWQFI